MPEKLPEKPPIQFAPLYSGGSLYLPNHGVPVVLDVAGMEIPPRALPVLLNHNPQDQVGVLDVVEAAGNGLPAISAYGHYIESPAAWEVRRLIQENVRWEGSIAAFRPAVADVEVVPVGVAVEVNGRKFVGPLKIFRKWKMREGSFVFFGADAYNNNQSVAANAQASHFIIERENPMSEELRSYIESIGMDPNDVTPEQATVLERCFKHWQAASSEEKKEDVAANGETSEEKKEDVAANGETSEEKKEDVAANGETSEEKKEDVAASGFYRNRPGNPAKTLGRGEVGTGKSGRPGINDVLTVALLESTGIHPDVAANGGFSESAVNEGLSGKWKGMGLRQMFIAAYEQRHGISLHGRIPGTFGRDCLAMMDDDERGGVKAGGLFSTIQPLTILQNILNLQYRNGFESYESISDKLAAVAYTNDLHEGKLVSYDISGNMQEIPKGGEIPNAALSDDEIPIQAKTHGFLLTLSEEDIINDNLDAFVRLPRKMGTKTSRYKDMMFFKELASQLSTLCSSAHGNTLTAALDVSGLDAAAAALSEMETLGTTGSQPEFTDVHGKYILTTRGLYPTARTLYNDSKCDLIGLGSYPVSNPHVGLYEPIASAYWGSRGFGNSDVHWAMFADPQEAAAMVLTYLRGEEKPRIEPFPTPPNILGRTWRCVYRFGVSSGDFRGIVYSTGAGN
ncbi:MAG: hypothetical protein Q4D98_14410 [Planctomycetia bacterium]|nr:hypothetical protein [Planctomycetia bacterium]